MKFDHVIVTGGSGFIGSHLVDALVPISKHVWVIDKEKAPKSRRNKKATYKMFDIKEEGLKEIFQKIKPEAVFHLAAHIHDRESVHEPVLNAEDNILGTIRVCEATRLFGRGKLVFTSTGVTYGIQEELPITESAEPKPLTPYAISKLTGERYLNFYEKVFSLPSVALRLGNVYGPRQDASAESGAIGIFASRFLKGEQVYVNNDGETTRDYVYVKDVVEALLKAATSDATGIFNIGTGVGTRTLDVYEHVKKVIGVQSVPTFREDVPDVVKHVALDASRAKKALGWEPQTDLETGTRETVDWYRDNI